MVFEMSTESIFAVLRYPDSHDAAAWLCRAYGFEVHDIIEQDEANQPCIMLRYGESHVIIAPTDSPSLEYYMIQPADAGNLSTQVCYISVDEIDQHYARACAAGAAIELPLSDSSEDGDRVYLSRDPEGHLWSFGPHPKPGAVKAATRVDAIANTQVEANQSTGTIRRLVSVLAGGIAVLLLANFLFFKGGAVTGVLASLSLEQSDLKSNEGSRASAAERREALYIERERKAAQAENEKLKSQLKISRLEFVRAVQQKKTAENTLTKTTERFETELAERLARLQDLSVAKQQVSAQLERHRLLVANYRSDLRKVDEDLQHLKDRTKGLSGEAQALRAERVKLSTALQDARRSLAETKQHSARTEVAEQELRKSLADLQAKYAKAVEHGKLADSKLQSTRTTLNLRLDNQQATINAIKKTNGEITRALAVERADVIKLRDEREAAKSSAARLLTEGKHLKREMSQLKERLVALTTARRNADEALTRTKQLLSARLSDAVPSEEGSSLTRRLRQQQEQIEKIKRDNAEVTNQFAAARAKAEKLDKERRTAQQEVARLRAKSKYLASQTKSLTAKVAALQKARLLDKKTKARPRRRRKSAARTARSKSVKSQPSVENVQSSPIPRDPRRRRELLSSIFDCDATVDCD